MKKSFTMVHCATGQYVVVGKAAPQTAVTRHEHADIVKVKVKPGHRRSLTRQTAKLLGDMLTSPVTEATRVKTAALIEQSRAADASAVTARFRRAAA